MAAGSPGSMEARMFKERTRRDHTPSGGASPVAPHVPPNGRCAFMMVAKERTRQSPRTVTWPGALSACAVRSTVPSLQVHHASTNRDASRCSICQPAMSHLHPSQIHRHRRATTTYMPPALHMTLKALNELCIIRACMSLCQWTMLYACPVHAQDVR
jgi:hypothetical protein